MSSKNILGGFLGENNVGISSLNVALTPRVRSGKYSVNEQFKLKYRSSWPGWSDSVGVGTYYSTAGTSNINFVTESKDIAVTHLFIVCAGGGGSGAFDNDCQGQGPGGAGGFGKALISISAVGSNVAKITVGSGGAGVSGNDAFGNPGTASSVTVGNFFIIANAGNGGNAKNVGGGSAGTNGNCSVSGPNLASSTSGIFYTPLIDNLSQNFVATYQTVRTNVNGSGGGCGPGGSSSPGEGGFVYLRYGAGINASTTLTPAQDYTASGNTHPYTASY